LCLDLAAQEGRVVFAGASLATGVGLRGAAATAAKALPPFLHDREPDPEAFRHRAWGLFATL
jgi:hypothetical protein